MNLTILAPYIRIQVFGAVVWALAKLGLPADLAGQWTDVATPVVILALSTAYGWWASKREAKKATP